MLMIQLKLSQICSTFECASCAWCRSFRLKERCLRKVLFNLDTFWMRDAGFVLPMMSGVDESHHESVLGGSLIMGSFITGS